jgi:hypothetical protein
MGRCGNEFDSRGRHTLFNHIPRTKPEVLTRNLALAKKAAKKPLIILTVSVDSFSRRHFFRKLPKTVEFINRLKAGGEYAVFDNKLHNVIGDDTLENMSHVFGERFIGLKFHNLPEDRYGDDAIWAKLKDMGFTTMLGFDGCAFKARRMMGWAPKVDHLSQTFFCAATRFARYTSAKKGTRM